MKLAIIILLCIVASWGLQACHMRHVMIWRPRDVIGLVFLGIGILFYIFVAVAGKSRSKR